MSHILVFQVVMEIRNFLDKEHQHLYASLLARMEFPVVKVCMLADSKYGVPENFKNVICQRVSCVCVHACAHVCLSNVSGWINLKLCVLYLP